MEQVTSVQAWLQRMYMTVSMYPLSPSLGLQQILDQCRKILAYPPTIKCAPYLNYYKVMVNFHRNKKTIVYKLYSTGEHGNLKCVLYEFTLLTDDDVHTWTVKWMEVPPPLWVNFKLFMLWILQLHWLDCGNSPAHCSFIKMPIGLLLQSSILSFPFTLYTVSPFSLLCLDCPEHRRNLANRLGGQDR